MPPRDRGSETAESTRTPPLNTGRVKIGEFYEPDTRCQMSDEALFMQDLLLNKRRKREPLFWYGELVLIAAYALCALVLIIAVALIS